MTISLVPAVQLSLVNVALGLIWGLVCTNAESKSDATIKLVSLRIMPCPCHVAKYSDAEAGGHVRWSGEGSGMDSACLNMRHMCSLIVDKFTIGLFGRFRGCTCHHYAYMLYGTQMDAVSGSLMVKGLAEVLAATATCCCT